MAQGRVTDYFSTRKRTRFNQDEMVVLNKQKKPTNYQNQPQVLRPLMK